MSVSSHCLGLPLLLLGSPLVGCGGDDEDALPDIKTLFPANNELGTWVEDTVPGQPGVQTATNDTDVVDLINGGAGPYLQRDYDIFAIEYYTSGTYDLELRVWQFASNAVATDIYDGLLQESSSHMASTWTNASMGDAGRMANTGATWWFNVRKGLYLIEQNIAFDSGAVVDDPCKAAGEEFIGRVLAKIK